MKKKTQNYSPSASQGAATEEQATDASGGNKHKQTTFPKQPGKAGSTKGTTMATTKRQRKYSQDFSGKSLTDQSFAPSCDVNAIVRHYEATGLDPHADRISLARYGEASTLTYEDAMRNAAELASFQAENPDWLSNQQAAQTAEIAPSEESTATAPQDASGGEQSD